MDYYNAKTNELEKKNENSNGNSDKIREQLEKSRIIAENMTTEFTPLNTECMEDISRALKLKETVFSCVIASYLDIQKNYL
eukprot:Pgem_evm1s15708